MRGISRVLSERVAFGTLVAALFALFPSCPLFTTYATMFAPRLCVLPIRSWHPVCGTHHPMFESPAVTPDSE